MDQGEVVEDLERGGRLQDALVEFILEQGIGGQAETGTQLLASQRNHVAERVIESFRLLGKLYLGEEALCQGTDLAFGYHENRF